VGTTGFGIDIGGSGIKGAVVDLDTGTLAAERLKISTPEPSTPDAVSGAIAEIVHHFAWDGPVGVAFPAAITGGVARTATNVHDSWIGTSVEEVVRAATGLPATAVNDADAAGVAEALWGAARGVRGLAIVATLGTGIGTALLSDGVLVPNSELGHIPLDGQDAELLASSAARDRNGWSWVEWADQLQRYFSLMEDLFWPERFVVGGGVSRKADKFLPLLSLRTEIVPAKLRNNAGIVGAAAFAAERMLAG
jgi:polyphosphate glucokinase